MRLFLLLLIFLVQISWAHGLAEEPPVSYAIIGLSHDHASGFLARQKDRTDVRLAGIVEPRRDLAARYAARFHLPTNLFFVRLEDLLAQTNVQAVATFTSTFDHRAVVELCAPKGIHVMMEKPLAVNLEHARAIQSAAEKGRIQVVVNYETTWYPANQTAYRLAVEENAIGDLRKIVVHDGHRGPREIGCSEAFLEWLTDPKLNGGGALNDFGCYGADLITWLMKGQRPVSVFAVTQQIKPDVYPRVEDEATIVLEYPKAQGIIQASWNWPFDRKDIEIYGKTGFVLAPKMNLIRVRQANKPEEERVPAALEGERADPLSYLAGVVRGKAKSSELSSLKINFTVIEILDAAHESARTGKRVLLK